MTNVSILKRVAFICFSALFAGNVFAAASVNDRPDTSSSFYENSEDGWFWYKDEKEEPRKPEQLKKQTPSPQEQLKNAENPEKAFSVAWLRKNIPRYLDLAIDNPTPENVRAFLLIQRIMLDKAENFSQAVQAQVVGDVLIDESARRGFSTVAANTLNAKGTKKQWTDTDRSRSIKSNALSAINSSPILPQRIFRNFTTKSARKVATCSYCKAQIPILGYFAKRYDIAIMGVSVDGIGFQTQDGKDPFPWKPDAGLAQKLGLSQVPALVLVTPKGDAEPISQGILSLNEIEQRILLVSKRKGWIKEEHFEKTRPMVEGMRNDLSKALQTSSPLSEQKLRSYQEADGFIPPDRLVPLVTMRAKVTNTDMSTVKSLKNAEKAVNEMKSVAETSKKK